MRVDKKELAEIIQKRLNRFNRLLTMYHKRCVDEPTEDNIETPMDLEESTEEVSDCGIDITTALIAFVEDVGCLEALYDPERGVYYVRNKNNFVKPPYELKVDSPIAEISPTALAHLKLDICKYFDI